MTETGALSEDLKHRIELTRVALIGDVSLELIADAIGRLGFTNIRSCDNNSPLPQCDVSIVCCTSNDRCTDTICHYKSVGVPVICVFNFGIGVCASVITPDSPLPNFIEDKTGYDAVLSMLDYARGYSAFWHIKRNRWLDYADKWIATQEISSSVGNYAMASVAAHLLIAIVAGNEVKTYPKFYLSTIVNDIY